MPQFSRTKSAATAFPSFPSLHSLSPKAQKLIATSQTEAADLCCNSQFEYNLPCNHHKTPCRLPGKIFPRKGILIDYYRKNISTCLVQTGPCNCHCHNTRHRTDSKCQLRLWPLSEGLISSKVNACWSQRSTCFDQPYLSWQTCWMLLCGWIYFKY